MSESAKTAISGMPVDRFVYPVQQALIISESVSRQRRIGDERPFGVTFDLNAAAALKAADFSEAGTVALSVTAIHEATTRASKAVQVQAIGALVVVALAPEARLDTNSLLASAQRKLRLAPTMPDGAHVQIGLTPLFGQELQGDELPETFGINFTYERAGQEPELVGHGELGPFKDFGRDRVFETFIPRQGDVIFNHHIDRVAGLAVIATADAEVLQAFAPARQITEGPALKAA